MTPSPSPIADAPVWQRIEASLLAEIAAGTYDETGRLPPEWAVAERFQVNRLTARRALAAQQERGAVRIERGRGTFVQRDMVRYALGLNTRFSQNLRRENRVPGRRLLGSRVLPAEPSAAAALRLPEGTPLLRLDVLGEADGRPLTIGLNHYEAARFPGLVDAFRQFGSLSAALRLYGVEVYVRQRTAVSARMPTAEQARLLCQPRTRPVLETEAVDVDAAGRPVAFGITSFAGDRVQLVVEG